MQQSNGDRRMQWVWCSSAVSARHSPSAQPPAHLLSGAQHRPIHPLAARVHRVPPFAVVEAVHRLGAEREARLHEAFDVPVRSVRVAAAAGCIAGKQAAGGPLHVAVKREQLRGRVVVKQQRNRRAICNAAEC